MTVLTLYLRCKRDHPNAVSLSDRAGFVGRPCSRCGEPLLAEPERERPPRRMY